MYPIPQLRGDEKAIYLRKSQADDPLLSLEEILLKHEQMLTEWVDKNQPEGGRVPDENIFREIGSGETISSRPQMQSLLHLVESPKIKAIMVTEPSRLTRGDLEDIGRLVKILRYSKTLVITLGYTYDLSDDRDRDNFERELMKGNAYLEYTKMIRQNGRITSVKNGSYIGNVPPYGYKKAVVYDGKRKVHTLEPHPEQAPIVHRIFEMYAKGNSWRKISDQFNKEHIPPPKGDKWSPNTLPAMLQNVHYLGKVKWNSRKAVRTVENGQVVVSRPRAEDYLIFEGRHPAIIEQELWDKVHTIIGTHPRNKKAHNLSNPLAGVIWCKNCGKAMTGRPYLDKNGKERCAARFVCPDARNCGNASAKMKDVMDEVVKVLQAALDDFEIQIKNEPEDNVTRHKKMIEKLEKRLEELKRTEVKHWAEKIKSGMPDYVFRQLNDPVVKEIAEIEQELHETRNTIPQPVNIAEKIVTLTNTLAALRDENAPVKEKNQLIKACIKRIEFSREKYTKVGTPKGMIPSPFALDFTLKL